MAKESPDPALTERFQAGDDDALGPWLEAHRARLRRMVDFRLDVRLRNRLDASDVVQEAFLDAAHRYEDYRRDPKMSPYLWVRFLTSQKLAEMHRIDLGAQARDVRREEGWPRPTAVDSSRMAMEFTDHGTLPDRAASRKEIRSKLEAALEALSPLDREVLVMRHFEQMSNADVAEELGIERDAASKRYLRALKRIKSTIDEVTGTSG